LAKDGGGVRGLTSLHILQEILQAAEKHVVRPVLPFECFDLIGGTSTGGLIAIMLGRLRMTIDEAIAAYKELAPEIFRRKWWAGRNKMLKYIGAEAKQYWFEGESLQNAVVKLLERRELDPQMKLLEEKGSPECKV
jgi:patatin-like phospholipase/acyl hydrolase